MVVGRCAGASGATLAGLQPKPSIENRPGKTMSHVHLTIFDCDGVLVDSEIISAAVEAELLQGVGYQITTRQIAERFVGLSWPDILRTLEGETGLPLFALLGDKVETVLDERLQREVQIIEGVAAALQQLPYPRCVCSNSKIGRLDVMLSKVGLRELFAPHIFSAKTLGEGRSKPKPDIFLYGAKEMGAEPANTIVVEDSVHGVIAARAAGMHVIGFTGASHTYPAHAIRLKEAGAGLVVSHMADLPDAIQTFARTRFAA